METARYDGATVQYSKVRGSEGRAVAPHEVFGTLLTDQTGGRLLEHPVQILFAEPGGTQRFRGHGQGIRMIGRADQPAVARDEHVLRAQRLDHFNRAGLGRPRRG